jgi:hypothetical protein
MHKPLLHNRLPGSVLVNGTGTYLNVGWDCHLTFQNASHSEPENWEILSGATYGISRFLHSLGR